MEIWHSVVFLKDKSAILVAHLRNLPLVVSDSESSGSWSNALTRCQECSPRGNGLVSNTKLSPLGVEGDENQDVGARSSHIRWLVRRRTSLLGASVLEEPLKNRGVKAEDTL